MAFRLQIALGRTVDWPEALDSDLDRRKDFEWVFQIAQCQKKKSIKIIFNFGVQICQSKDYNF